MLRGMPDHRHLARVGAAPGWGTQPQSSPVARGKTATVQLMSQDKFVTRLHKDEFHVDTEF